MINECDILPCGFSYKKNNIISAHVYVNLINSYVNFNVLKENKIYTLHKIHCDIHRNTKRRTFIG